MRSFGTNEALQRKIPHFGGFFFSSAPLSLHLSSTHASWWAYGSQRVRIANARRAVSSLQSKDGKVRESAELPHKSSSLLPASLAACFTLCSGAALASTHAEPANALSVPTWVIHISSVIEWTTAMLLMWRYAEATGNEKWKGMTWGMMPLFSGALCACTYHFFYNSPQLDFLVTLQATLTWIGNATLWAAAYRIFKDTQTASSS